MVWGLGRLSSLSFSFISEKTQIGKLNMPNASEACPFCNIPAERIFFDDFRAYMIFSWYPVSKYHTLIIPRRHITDTELDEKEILAIYHLKEKMLRIMGKTGAFEYNFGVNNGIAAGQSVTHCHYHLIFRDVGDTPNPRGGVRGVIPAKQNPVGDTEEQTVAGWTKSMKEFLGLEQK